MQREIEEGGPRLTLIAALKKVIDSIDAEQVEMKNHFSFGCIIARNDDNLFKNLSNEHQENLKALIDNSYENYKISVDVEKMVENLLEKMASTDMKEIMCPLEFIATTIDKKEYEDICVMHKIVDGL